MNRARPPRIGATTYREPARRGDWDELTDLLPASYAIAIEQAGGVAMLLPPAPPARAAAALDGVDGLLLSGGADVDPDRYGAAPHARTGAPRVARDAWELALLDDALERDLPVLAVCRGMQLLNVARGGDVVQHLPDEVGSDSHQPRLGEHGRHAVELASESRLAGVVGPRIEVATYHHQGVGTLGKGLAACGWAEDGVVEAVELSECGWVFGVQWHPEAYAGHELFAAFVAACAERAAHG
ncbi:MAG TPA: gamma-glutamyl-gamma-aminobutyrate hydrolase family protein [Jatrophihabitans sp.]|nr:gamma-glutamyl-gamma-aminobutyrate hydrolase family protein [Jatrophihabitans sp.]